jgi:hypothetical protein
MDRSMLVLPFRDIPSCTASQPNMLGEGEGEKIRFMNSKLDRHEATTAKYR